MDWVTFVAVGLALGFLAAAGGYLWKVIHRAATWVSVRAGDWLRGVITDALDEHVRRVLARPLEELTSRVDTLEASVTKLGGG